MRRSTFANPGARQVEPIGRNLPFSRKSAVLVESSAMRLAVPSSSSRKALSMAKPESASVMAVCSSSRHGRVPYFLCASYSPATEPGTPAASAPVTERSVGWPLASRYMSRVAAAGAVSRKSRATLVPLMRATMKPPPPRLPAEG